MWALDGSVVQNEAAQFSSVVSSLSDFGHSLRNLASRFVSNVHYQYMRCVADQPEVTDLQQMKVPNVSMPPTRLENVFSRVVRVMVICACICLYTRICTAESLLRYSSSCFRVWFCACLCVSI